MEITVDEIMVTCIARQVEDGEFVVQGLATPLVAAAYLLARHTHAPNLYFASAIGQSMCREPAPIGLTNIEALWADRSISNVGFVTAAADFLPSLKPKEYFRPGQMDPNGNFNNIAFGKNYKKPRLRLPGTGGIPDVTTYISDIYLYVPRHSRLTFVEKLDFLSGLGHNPARKNGAGPCSLVTDLGLFDFQNGRMRLVSYHPGVEIRRIHARTGFLIEISSKVHETKSPSKEVLRLHRQEIDPLGIRRLEFLSGAPRRQLLEEILRIEENESSHLPP